MKLAAGAPARQRAARRRGPLLVAGVALLLILLAVGRAAGPYLFRVATLQSEIATQVRVTTGLILATPGRARFDLLPSPRIKMATVHVRDPSGTLTIDADALEGEVRLLPLLVGRLELASATLTKPRLVIDLDGRPVPPDSLIGRAIHAPAGTTASGDQRLGAVTLVDGTATLVGHASRNLPQFSALDMTVDWRDLDSPATLTGTMRVADTFADVAAWIEQPSALMRGDRSAATLRLRSSPLDLAANGDVVVGSTPAARFKGQLTASAPSLAGLLALCGRPGALPAPFADLTLQGEATAAIDRAGALTLDLPSLHLTADNNSYEGTLAFQGTGTPSLSGTLAADQLALQPFLARLPPLLGPARAWSGAVFAGTAPAPLQLDLRISAAHLRLPPFTVDDAAFSVMTRGDRIEIGLNEGAAYGGALKGRLSVGTAPNGLSLRGAGSLDGADAAAMGWDLVGRQVAAGTLSGSGAFETGGDAVAPLMANLKGWARGTATDGDFTGADLGLGLRALTRGRPAEAAAALSAGRTPFRTLGFDMRLDGGVATIGEATMQGRDANLTASGSIDIGKRRLDLHAVATTPDGTGTGAKLPLEIGGTFDTPVFPALPSAPAQ